MSHKRNMPFTSKALADFAFQYHEVVIAELEDDYNSLPNNFNPQQLVLHFELDPLAGINNMLTLVGYWVKMSGQHKAYKKVRSEAFQKGDKYININTPIGLGDIYVDIKRVTDNWFRRTTDTVSLKPFSTSNPTLALSDGTSLNPSPPYSQY